MDDNLSYLPEALKKPKVFRKLVEQYKGYVFAVILRYISDKYIAEDIAQETFVKAHSKINEYRGGDIKIWLGRIAANLSIDYLRKKKPKIEYIEELVDDKGSIGIEDELVTKETYCRLNDEIERMDSKYGEIIKLYYYEKMSYKEIAKFKNIPEKTVETRLYRARKHLRKVMENEI